MQDSRNIVTPLLFAVLAVVCVVLAVGDLLIGTTNISFGDVWSVLCGTAEDDGLRTIVMRMRLPKIIVAAAAGMALSASGLQMQTLFRNPLAGPYVLGVNAGASLGVALFTLATPMLGIAAMPWLVSFGVTGMAWIGSATILLLVMSLSRKIRNINTILIVGMMLSSAIRPLSASCNIWVRTSRSRPSWCGLWARCRPLLLSSCASLCPLLLWASCWR